MISCWQPPSSHCGAGMIGESHGQWSVAIGHPSQWYSYATCSTALAGGTLKARYQLLGAIQWQPLWCRHCRHWNSPWLSTGSPSRSYSTTTLIKVLQKIQTKTNTHENTNIRLAQPPAWLSVLVSLRAFMQYNQSSLVIIEELHKTANLIQHKFYIWFSPCFLRSMLTWMPKECT